MLSCLSTLMISRWLSGIQTGLEADSVKSADFAGQTAGGRGDIDMFVHADRQPLAVRRPAAGQVRPVQLAAGGEAPRPAARRRYDIDIGVLIAIPGEGDLLPVGAELMPAEQGHGGEQR